MTNKTERYFVVSESELEKLRYTATHDTECGDGDYSDTDKAEAACRAREVRFIGAADQGSSLMLWGEVKK